jgi:hypothetical protein
MLALASNFRSATDADRRGLDPALTEPKSHSAAVVSRGFFLGVNRPSRATIGWRLVGAAGRTRPTCSPSSDAMKVLRERGLIFTVHGQGTYVA